MAKDKTHPDKILLPGHKNYKSDEVESDKSLILHEVQGQKFYITQYEAIDLINQLSGDLVVRGRIAGLEKSSGECKKTL